MNEELTNYIQHGDQAMESEDYLGAITNFMQAYQINPKHAPALIGLGKATATLNRYEESLKWFKAAMQEYPVNAMIYIYAAYVCRQLELNDQSLRYASEAHRLVPSDLEPLTSMALAYAKLGQHDQATRILNEAENLFSEHPEIEETKALIAEQRGYFTEAAKHFEIASERFVRSNGFPDASYLYSLGANLFKLKKYEAARNAFCQATVNSPPNYLIYTALGRAEINLGNWEDSAKAFEVAIKANPLCEEAYSGAIYVYKQLSKKQFNQRKWLAGCCSLKRVLNLSNKLARLYTG